MGRGDVEGTNGPDVIVGSAGTRRIDGKGGRDTICAGSGENVIDGGPGRDKLAGQGANDTIDADATDIVRGGSGFDEVRYRPFKGAEAGVEVDLAKDVVRWVADLADDLPAGSVRTTERVLGTEFADELRGDGGENHLFGEEGRDFVDGREGNDKLQGGGGLDEVSYEKAPAAVKVTQEQGESASLRSALVGRHRDLLQSFELVTGSDHDDTLEGSDDQDYLYGGKGDDTIRGFEENDRLFGGAGDDDLAPGAGDDYVDGGENRPVMNEDERGDLVNFKEGQLEGGHDQMQVNLDLNLPPYVSPFQPRRKYHATGEGNDIITGVESVRGMDAAFNFIYGNDRDNVIVGGKKGDYVEAFDGNDWVFTGGYPDTLYGGDGNDYLDHGDGHEITDGEEGNDTCTHQSEPDYRSNCEKEAKVGARKPDDR